MDGGIFEKPLQEPRVLVTLKCKLQVLDRVKELRKERDEAKKILAEPRPVRASKEAKQDWINKKHSAKKALRKGIGKTIASEFGPVLKKSQICKWEKAAEKECWREMPDSVLARVTATSNTWRKKLNLPGRGNAAGTCKIPLILQQELDFLMMEASGGLSDISERKEMVSNEDIAPHQNLEFLFQIFFLTWNWFVS